MSIYGTTLGMNLGHRSSTANIRKQIRCSWKVENPTSFLFSLLSLTLRSPLPLLFFSLLYFLTPLPHPLTSHCLRCERQVFRGILYESSRGRKDVNLYVNRNEHSFFKHNGRSVYGYFSHKDKVLGRLTQIISLPYRHKLYATCP